MVSSTGEKVCISTGETYENVTFISFIIEYEAIIVYSVSLIPFAPSRIFLSYSTLNFSEPLLHSDHMLILDLSRPLPLLQS